MSNYVSRIRAEWLEAGWTWNPLTRAMILPVVDDVTPGLTDEPGNTEPGNGTSPAQDT